MYIHIFSSRMVVFINVVYKGMIDVVKLNCDNSSMTSTDIYRDGMFKLARAVQLPVKYSCFSSNSGNHDNLKFPNWLNCIFLFATYGYVRTRDLRNE